MTISTLIIDDESLARQRLKNLILEIPELKVLDSCSTGKKAIEKINELQPDLIFLDIKLKDMNGFDILEKISTEKKPLIIFISAYDEYALKAFDFFAFDYLLKPFKDERFFKAITNVINHFKVDNIVDFEDKLNNLIEYVKKDEEAQANNKNVSKDKLAIKLGNKVSFLEMKEIKYIIASGYYAEIYTDERKHLLRESLTHLTERLDPNQFVRIHRSTIININSVSELIHSNYGEIDLKTTDNKLFRISKSYKKEFQLLMGL
jgi:two-component system LytT family response regulator